MGERGNAELPRKMSVRLGARDWTALRSLGNELRAEHGRLTVGEIVIASFTILDLRAGKGQICRALNARAPLNGKSHVGSFYVEACDVRRLQQAADEVNANRPILDPDLEASPGIVLQALARFCVHGGRRLWDLLHAHRLAIDSVDRSQAAIALLLGQPELRELTEGELAQAREMLDQRVRSVSHRLRRDAEETEERIMDAIEDVLERMCGRPEGTVSPDGAGRSGAHGR
jgi:hypothetical protein